MENDLSAYSFYELLMLIRWGDHDDDDDDKEEEHV
jgi:hypothetical protein